MCTGSEGDVSMQAPGLSQMHRSGSVVGGEAACAGGGGMWETPAPSALVCCDLETALKITACAKERNTRVYVLIYTCIRYFWKVGWLQRKEPMVGDAC